MQTPTDELKKACMQEVAAFEAALRDALPGGLGAPLTRAESALLLTFALWRADAPQVAQSAAGPAAPQGQHPGSGEPGR